MKISPSQRSDHDDYAPLLESVCTHFALNVGGGPLFTTDALDLFPTFLALLPDEHRQQHKCHACRRFVEQYGGLVTISAVGELMPVIWGDAPGIYAQAFRVLRAAVANARVTGVFKTSEARWWGTPVTGNFHHMAVSVHNRFGANFLVQETLKTAGQVMAEKREDYGMLQRALAEFKLPVVECAVSILSAEVMYRGEKVLGVATWLRDLRVALTAKSHRTRDNIIWRAVASAPPGFCHVRSSMIGTLLEDLDADLPIEVAKRKFAEKMSPLTYQRPQAPPTVGNIAQAEKIVAKLRTAGSLERRFARLDEITAIWRPTPPPFTRMGSPPKVFGHLTPRQKTPMQIDGGTMTWEKFRRTVLPTAERIEFRVPNRENSYLAMLTAVNPEAPPILQWDTLEWRNPVSWYVYPGGSRPEQFNLHPATFVQVTAIALLPFMWGPNGEERFPHQGAGAVFILDSCRDVSPRGGAALFPEILKSEYREIRSTIEAHSRSATIAGASTASACGYDFRKGEGTKTCVVRVIGAGGATVVEYTLDRWD